MLAHEQQQLQLQLQQQQSYSKPDAAFAHNSTFPGKGNSKKEGGAGGDKGHFKSVTLPHI
jgi:hypothetical protein